MGGSAPAGARDRLVEIEVRQDEVALDSSVVRAMERSIETCLERQGLAGSEVSLSIVDDREMHELNLRYRGVDRTTDVLSFPLEEERPKEPCLLGDIVVSAPQAVRQAGEYGHSLLREMSFLVVHGTLHLLGYDHVTPDEDDEMQRLQEEVLAALGIGR